MPPSLAGKVIVVTGSASGVGLATAKALLAQGASVAMCDVNRSKMQETLDALDAEYKDMAMADAVDITDRSAVKSFLEAAREHFGGKISGVANIAGTGGHHLGQEAVWETAPDEYEFIMNLNVKGLFNVLAECLKPGLMQEPGSFVHISSIYSVRGYANGAVFSASKHAAVGMVKSAAIEAGSRGIRVNVVMPGAIDTPMLHYVRGLTEGGAHSSPNTPIPRFGAPDEVAKVVAFLLGDESGYVTGATWEVDGGANA